MSPELLLRVVNLTVPRRPGRAPAVNPNPLATVADAAGALGVPAVADAELPALHELHRVVVDLVDRLLGGGGLEQPAERLSGLADASRAGARLEVCDARLQQRLDWSDPTLASGLARRILLEVGAIDSKRLRRCERAECDLVFYDQTRSNTQRWHAESPCGLRERQRRHRALAATATRS